MADKYPHPWGKVAQDYRRFRIKLPDAVAIIAVNEFKENFRREGYRDDRGKVVKWAKRKRYKNKRDKSRGVLTKTARLKRGFRKKSSYNEARVVNNTIYASTHHFGDKERGIPERPIVKHSKALEKDIEKHYFKELDKIFKKA